MRPLIVTNGSVAGDSILRSGIDAAVLSWDDALTDGPLHIAPLARLSLIRAQALHRLGWGDEETLRARFAARNHALHHALAAERPVMLWFERDLYDQLQLAQILHEIDLCAISLKNLRIIHSYPLIANAPPERLFAYFASRRRLSRALVAHGSRAWRAFCSPTPGRLALLAREHPSPLPFMAAAAKRLLAEYPDPVTGLGVTHWKIVRDLRDGVSAPVDLFRRHQSSEPDPFLGDASFWLRIAELSSGPRPLVQTALGEPFRPPPLDAPQVVARERLRLTELGRAVAEGRSSGLTSALPRRVGGVVLEARDRCWLRA